MNHYTEEDLVLFHYDDHDDAESIREHLAGCADCSAAHASLRALLQRVEMPALPERDAAYPARVWSRVAARIERRRFDWRGMFTWSRLAVAGSMAAVILVAFLYGQYDGSRRTARAFSEEARQRILMLAVGEHLERSQRMLTDVVNTSAGPGLDLGDQQRAATRLAADNRIYRASAAHAGERQMAELLEDLERVLIEIANSPSAPDAREFNRLWRRIEGSGLMIKMKILETDTRRRAGGGLPAQRI